MTKSKNADAARFDAAVDARAQLQERARPLLPEDFDFAMQSDRQIYEAVLALVYPGDTDLSDKSDAYARARFEYAVESGRLNPKQKRGEAPAKRSDAADSFYDELYPELEAPPDRSAQWRLSKFRPLWQRPLGEVRLDASNSPEQQRLLPPWQRSLVATSRRSDLDE